MALQINEYVGDGNIKHVKEAPAKGKTKASTAKKSKSKKAGAK